MRFEARVADPHAAAWQWDGGGDFGHLVADIARPRSSSAAADVAWLESMAWFKFRGKKYLDAADASLRWLEASPVNPYYEGLLPIGACLAARSNAELGRG